MRSILFPLRLFIVLLRLSWYFMTSPVNPQRFNGQFFVRDALLVLELCLLFCLFYWFC